MEKSKDLREQEAREIYNKYSKQFEKYQIYSFEEMQVSILPEHLAKRFPEKYGPDSSNYMNYQKDENLNEVYVFDGGKGEAYFFGTENAVLQGHIANENLKDGKITLSRELSEKTAGVIFSNDPKKIKEFEENFFHGQGKDLDVLERILEKRGNFAKEINKTKNEIDPSAPDVEFNEKENQAVRKSNSKDTKVSLENEKEENKKELPEDVVNACGRIGVNQIRGYFYVNAAQLTNEVDDTRATKTGNKVLIIEVYDNKLGCNKYYGFQDDKMVLYGNDTDANKAVKAATGNVTQMGKILEPLKPEKQYLEYEDSQGLVVREEIDDGTIQEKNDYREKMEDLLEKYSANIYLIKESDMPEQQKKEQIQKINNYFDVVSEDVSPENLDDTKNITETVEYHTEETKEEIVEETKNDEPEAWEVPGKRKIGE